MVEKFFVCYNKLGDCMERLQKVIANRGYCSRRKAEEYIKEGKVFVNGNRVSELGLKVDENVEIRIDGKVLEKDEKVYILLNKPRGVVSTVKDEKMRKTVLDLIDTSVRVYPVGRLDYDTTGLLLLTNDGDLTNLLIHPKNRIDKVYVAKIVGILKGEEIRLLKQGVFIDGKKTSSSKVRVKSVDYKNGTSVVEIIIHEGKNHQVKKMFESVGHTVLKLKREKVAFLNLKGLHSGEYRYLNPKEVKKLYAFVKNN